MNAAEAYKNLVDISIAEYPDFFMVTFTNCIYDEKQTVKEFGNYVIGLMNQHNGSN